MEDRYGTPTKVLRNLVPTIAPDPGHQLDNFLCQIYTSRQPRLCLLETYDEKNDDSNDACYPICYSCIELEQRDWADSCRVWDTSIRLCAKPESTPPLRDAQLAGIVSDTTRLTITVRRGAACL